MSIYYVKKICSGELSLITIHPIRVKINYNKKEKLFECHIKSLNIYAHSETIEGLKRELGYHISELWCHYVLEDDTKMTDRAKNIKYKLLETLEAIG